MNKHIHFKIIISIFIIGDYHNRINGISKCKQVK